MRLVVTLDLPTNTTTEIFMLASRITEMLAAEEEVTSFGARQVSIEVEVE